MTKNKIFSEHHIFTINAIKPLNKKINSILHEVSKIIMRCKLCDDKEITNEHLLQKLKIKDTDFDDVNNQYIRNNAYLTLLTRRIDEKELKIFIEKLNKLSIYGTKRNPLFSIGCGRR